LFLEGVIGKVLKKKENKEGESLPIMELRICDLWE
jgi:hypothetical protein